MSGCICHRCWNKDMHPKTELIVWGVDCNSFSVLYPGVDFGTTNIAYVHNFTNESLDLTRSCYKRCHESRPRSVQVECMCDKYCMFIGDCCYDYLMECDKRALDINTALNAQSNLYQQFKRYSSCKTNYLRKKLISYMLQVSTCPNGNDDFKELCEGRKSKGQNAKYTYYTVALVHSCYRQRSSLQKCLLCGMPRDPISGSDLSNVHTGYDMHELR